LLLLLLLLKRGLFTLLCKERNKVKLAFASYEQPNLTSPIAMYFYFSRNKAKVLPINQ
jgi:hypothetical protein